MPGIFETRGFDPEGEVVGIGLGSGQKWRDNRRLMMSELKTMGVGDKNKMEMIIEEEAEQFCDILEERVSGTKDGIIPVRENPSKPCNP